MEKFNLNLLLCKVGGFVEPDFRVFEVTCHCSLNALIEGPSVLHITPLALTYYTNWPQ